MQIRQKLTYQFILVVAFILLFASLAIYFFSADYREDLYYTRLQNKASSTAKLLIEVDEVDLALLTRIEKDNPVSLPNEKITILNSNNEVLYSSDEQSTLKITANLLDSIRSSGEIRFRQGEYEVLGFLFEHPNDSFVVIAGAVDIYGFNRMKNLRTILLSVFGISIVLVSLAGWIYAGKALQPISRVIDEVDEITISSLNLRVHEGESQDEIAKLAKTFNNMLDRLETAFKVQKNFIANASHELRTPLTTITGQLDVALMNERSNAEYKQIITSVLDDIKNLNTVSNRLLLLAQASSGAAAAEFGTVRIDDVVLQLKSELTKLNPAYKIHITLNDNHIEEEQLVVAGNEQLLKTAIGNLIDNGCKFSTDHTVQVLIEATRKHLSLRISDKGIGIDPGDLRHVFEPFYRGKNASVVRGHGIGLSLVERILDLHQGKIEISSTPGKGTVVTTTLPLASASMPSA
jgi:signal transduction histidine kinase